MTEKNSGWKPALSDEAEKKLIDAAIDAAGTVCEEELPFKIRERLKGQLSGDLDVDAYVAEVLRKRKNS